jgi:Tfp pilus assembly protein PilN
MREMEFLPPWYPQVRRNLRLAVVEVWLLVVLVGGVGLWKAFASRSVNSASAALASLEGQQTQTDAELKKLDELEAIKRQLGQMNIIVSRLGIHVESTRILKAIESAMPPEMALLNLRLDTDEKTTGSNLAAARSAQGGEAPIERRLRVRLLAVAPTDVVLAEFLRRLSDVRCFEQVAMTYARERNDGKRVMREFEVTFSINITSGSGN